jgi:regulator of sirC expression with transglutaminase-like and TPR domain
MQNSFKKRKALVALLEDPDERIYLVVSQVIRLEGTVMLELLDEVSSKAEKSELQRFRASEIAEKIRLEAVRNELKLWKDSHEKDLLQAIISLSKIHNPHLNEAKVFEQMEQLRRDVWLELNDYQTAFEQVKVLNHVFFKVHGFHSSEGLDRSVNRLNIAQVLKEKKGDPLIIGLIYSIIANWLDVPIHGIDLPQIFILARMDENHSSLFNQHENPYGVLFYINPSVKGLVFDEEQIHQFLKQLEVAPERKYFEPASNTEIVQRYLLAYEESCKFSGDMLKFKTYEALKNWF